MFISAFICFIGLNLCTLIYLTSPKRRLPRNIPVVPLYTLVYDILRGRSRVEFYNTRVRHLTETAGAVGIWHDGQWVVLATKPEFVSRVFKNEGDLLEKNGLYHRVPGGIFAWLFGENIIDSDGGLHRFFTQVVKPGILRRFSIKYMRVRSALLAGELYRKQTEAPSSISGTSVGEHIWRWAIEIFGEYFLDLELHPRDLDFSQYSIQQIIIAHNRSPMGRLTGLFPVLDRLPWRWRTTQRTLTRFGKVENLVLSNVNAQIRRKPGTPAPKESDKLIHHLNRAHEDGSFSNFHYRSNLKQLFVAGHENVEMVAISAMLELAKNPGIQQNLYTELTQSLGQDYSSEDVDSLPLLTSVIYEALRLYPPLIILANRRAKSSMQLGDGFTVPRGTLIAWHSYGTHTDPQYWGPAAMEFRPDRWGSDCAVIQREFRIRQARGMYFPFGLHSRRCLGSRFALIQLKVVLCELVRDLEWNLPGDYQTSLSTGTLLAPRDCRLVIRKRSEGAERMDASLTTK
ncbi:cytochrome P450-DIT2 [Aspergillus udagawae]|uniref:Cytochrome P450-DIT2 n=1 Tax=Aspergillus udagawae TaxID=91492 RepID=A0A8H3SE29_9EURO|nr:cytochrome P450-DIT2 [Aspergillus udagawae]